MNKFNCENCGKEHDGSFASGRFCSRQCSNSFSSKNVNRKAVRECKCLDCGVTLIRKATGSIKNAKCKDCKLKSRVKSLTCEFCGALKIIREGKITKSCKRPNICKKIPLIPNLSKYLGFDESTIGSEDAYKEIDKIISILDNDYNKLMLSGPEMSKKYGCSNAASILKICQFLGIKTRDSSEAITLAIMQGKLEHPCPKKYKTGWHTTWDGKKIFYRSSYELEFAQMLDEQKIKYEVEFLKIGYFDTQLARQRLAIPDFYLPETNEIVEVKSSYTYDEQNMKDKFKVYQEHGYKCKLWLDKVYVNIKKS